MKSSTPRPTAGSRVRLVVAPDRDPGLPDNADGDHSDRRPEVNVLRGVLGALLAPVRAPQRVVADIAAIAAAVLSLQRDAHDRLASVDERAGSLASAVGALRGSLGRVERKVAELASLEEVVTVRMDAIRDDLNRRMLAVEDELQGMGRPIEQMSRDLAAVVELLPDPTDGPLARLRDTLTAS